MNIPHHDGSPLCVEDAAPALGDVVRVRLRVPAAFGTRAETPLAGVRVRSNPDREPSWSDATLVATDAEGWEWWEAAVTVVNPRHGYRWMLTYSDGRVSWLNQSGLSHIEQRDDDDFALLAHPAPPAWLAESVMYQVFPDRFARSEAADERPAPEWAISADWDDPVDPVMPARVQQFYGGDLDGVTDRLDHLASLGVNLIYLTPFFPARSAHRYDASSFTSVDPLLGGDDALVRLTEAAHARGIRVIGDLTTNHSGDGHEWFRRAEASADAPERDFYYFGDDGDYESWLGAKSLPKFDWSSPELRRRFIDGPDSVVARWLKPPFSLDGWRIDVASMTGRFGDVDLNAEVRQTIRRTMIAENPDTVLLAESTNDATEDMQGDAWHGAMTYTILTRPVWAWLSDPQPTPYVGADGEERTVPWYFGLPFSRYDARDVVDSLQRFTSGYPWRVQLGNMNALDTHDTARFRTHAIDGGVPVALGLTVTLPGVPVVFAGDEFGAVGADGESSRTPVPWGTESDPGVAETLSLYRDLLALRGAHPALATGGLRWIAASEEALAFVRESADETVLVFAARSAATLAIPAGSLPESADAAHLFGEGVSFDGAELSSTGTALGVWTLPGVAAPAW
ncbi:alpha-amylase family glycosyl hydrolase [Microbacterium sp. gxy059]|uniref:glycoside hydrolase family 13 protein n=1 Tax=Microbacterium sp. gxy059 TaxID=2957199 RepID=UPI003D958FA2